MHVLSLRGGLVETAHPIRAVAFQYDAAHTCTQVYAAGPPTHSPWRSAGKAVQAWVSIAALGDPALTEAELAIGVSSHSGEPGQVDIVRGLLSKLGVDEDALRCGAEPPVHAPTWADMIRAGSPPLAIHNDCSGKHALMLGACVQQGWSLEYLHPEHPLQRRIVQAVAAWTEEEPALAVDGCGVPTFYLSVAGMARCWSRMATAIADGHVRGAADPRMQRIGQAAMARPELTSGQGRIDLAIAARAAEPFVGKIGAGGVFCMALPARRMGIALKVISGNEDALAVAVPAVLDAAAPGSLRPAESWPWSSVYNVAGRKVGWRVVTGANRV